MRIPEDKKEDLFYCGRWAEKDEGLWWWIDPSRKSFSLSNSFLHSSDGQMDAWMNQIGRRQSKDRENNLNYKSTPTLHFKIALSPFKITKIPPPLFPIASIAPMSCLCYLNHTSIMIQAQKVHEISFMAFVPRDDENLSSIYTICHPIFREHQTKQQRTILFYKEQCTIPYTFKKFWTCLVKILMPSTMHELSGPLS